MFRNGGCHKDGIRFVPDRSLSFVSITVLHFIKMVRHRKPPSYLMRWTLKPRVAPGL